MSTVPAHCTAALTQPHLRTINPPIKHCNVQLLRIHGSAVNSFGLKLKFGQKRVFGQKLMFGLKLKFGLKISLG